MQSLSTISTEKNVGDLERGISIASGAALVCSGLKRGSAAGYLTALAGGAALFRGVTGYCSVYSALNINTACQGKKENKSEDIKIEHTVSIRRPRKEVYNFWRKLENLVLIMTRLKKVQLNPDGTSHWEAKGPFGKTIAWDSRVINEIPGELIAWRSIPGSELSNAGTVRFEDGGDGITHVRLTLAYSPPGGEMGEALAEFLGDDPRAQLREDLNRFKEKMENPDKAESGEKFHPVAQKI